MTGGSNIDSYKNSKYRYDTSQTLLTFNYSYNMFIDLLYKGENKFSNNFNIDELFRIEYHYKLKLTFYPN